MPFLPIDSMVPPGGWHSVRPMSNVLDEILSRVEECFRRRVESALRALGSDDGTLWLVGGAARRWLAEVSVYGAKDIDLLRDSGFIAVQPIGELLKGCVAGDGQCSMNQMGGHKLAVGGVTFDVWDSNVVDYLSCAPLAADGCAVRLSDGFTLRTGESVECGPDFEITSRPVVKHPSPLAWASHVQHVREYSPVRRVVCR